MTTTTPVPIYIAAPFTDAALVRDIEPRFLPIGAESHSTWAQAANGPERLESMPLEMIQHIAAANDRDLLSAFAVIVLSRDGAGGEMFAEARLALEYGIPVVWVGRRRPLTAYRPGVVRVHTVEEAVEIVALFVAAVRQPWPVEENWARDTLWSLVEKLAEETEVAA
jgi:hypothetical protein